MNKLVYSKNDFNDLRYPVFSVEDHLLDKIPELAPYAEILTRFDPRPDIDNLIRYVFVLYDKKSKLIRGFNNLDLRKKEAAVLAGYDLEKDAERVATLFDFSDPVLQALTLYFLEEQNHMWFCNLISSEQAFYEYQKALMDKAIDIDGDKDKMATLVLKSKLQDECDKLAERVETYYTKVYGDGAEKNVAKTQSFSPESIARRK